MRFTIAFVSLFASALANANAEAAEERSLGHKKNFGGYGFAGFAPPLIASKGAAPWPALRAGGPLVQVSPVAPLPVQVAAVQPSKERQEPIVFPPIRSKEVQPVVSKKAAPAPAPKPVKVAPVVHKKEQPRPQPTKKAAPAPAPKPVKIAPVHSKKQPAPVHTKKAVPVPAPKPIKVTPVHSKKQPIQHSKGVTNNLRYLGRKKFWGGFAPAKKQPVIQKKQPVVHKKQPVVQKKTYTPVVVQQPKTRIVQKTVMEPRQTVTYVPKVINVEVQEPHHKKGGY